VWTSTPRSGTGELKTDDGHTVVVGTFIIADGCRSWGSTISVNSDR
jgi:hypothetical protein